MIPYDPTAPRNRVGDSEGIEPTPPMQGTGKPRRENTEGIDAASNSLPQNRVEGSEGIEPAPPI